MYNYCGMCGAKREQADKFCFQCGAKLEETEVEVIPEVIEAEVLITGEITTEDTETKEGAEENLRERLTREIICKDIEAKKHRIWAFLGDFIMLTLCLVVGIWGGSGVILLSVFWVASIIGKIRENIRFGQKRFYILERPCSKKEYRDDGNDYVLWFEERAGKWLRAMYVDKEFYDATEVGEEFYVVFVEHIKKPCLCYKKKHWNFQG